MGAASLELRRIESLTVYDRNARKHSAKQIEKLAASIREFGFNAPVLVDGKGVILAGHGRLEAARKLGLKQVPVIPLTHFNDARRRAYILADNRIADAAMWDEDLLAAELTALSADGFDLELTGFDIPEIDDLLDHSAGPVDDPRIEAAPEPPAQPVSRLGDIWLLGAHRLMCGDLCSEADVSALCAGVVPDLANCDPPYGISVVKSASDGGAKPFGKVGGGKPHPFAGDRKGRVHGPAPLGPTLRGRVHPTQKPVALAEWVFGAVAPEAKTVIDLFCGSGSTLIACERKRKAGVLMEMAPAYVDVAVRRWQEFAKGEDFRMTCLQSSTRRATLPKLQRRDHPRCGGVCGHDLQGCV